MKFFDWLSMIDTSGLACNIYFAEDEKDADPIYCGSMSDIPYWLADYQIAKFKDRFTKPIEFAHSIRKNVNDENGTKGYNGFVIILTEKEDED